MTQVSKVYSILVGIDYSTASEIALEHALGLAALRPETVLHIVHVIPEPAEVPTSNAPSSDNARAGPMPEEPASDAPAHRQLDTYVAVSIGAFEKQRAGDARDPVQVITHVRSHEPAHQIAQLASDLEVDLVVVGTHGRGAVARFFMGSVAERVTRLAPCPVLVFRPKAAPLEYPAIEAPCPDCVEARVKSGGGEYWCRQHRRRQGQRHFYRDQSHRVSETANLPLVFGQRR
jgi:nucleotide-binding universal stress UspA family protein